MLPDWLLWLLPVPLATLGALVWGSWSSRARGPQDTVDTVQQYERFRAALGSSVRAQPPGDREPDGGRRAG